MTNAIDLAAKDPTAARKQAGIRFHHFLDDESGQLVGTIVTAPSISDKDLVLVGAAVCRSDETATRSGGRLYALTSLRDTSVSMPADELRAAIRDRSIFELVAKVSNTKVPSRVRAKKLRPRGPTPARFLTT